MDEIDHCRRRALLAMCAAASLAPFTAHAADAFLERLSRLIVSFPPGGATDLIAREFARYLKDVWHQAIIVENRPGAAGVIAAETVIRAEPDGTTLFFTTDGAITGIPFLPEKAPYDPLTDLKPIAIVAGLPLVLVANPSLGVKTVKEFVALAKKNPGQINYASGGTGASHHLSMEALQRAAGIQLNHIPYRGGAPALQDVLANQVPVMWCALSTSISQIQAKKIVALAIGSLERSTLLPDLPTMDELGYPKFEAGNWVGLMGPAGLADAQVAKISAAAKQVVHLKAYREALANQGNEARDVATADFTARIRTELERNQQLAKTILPTERS